MKYTWSYSSISLFQQCPRKYYRMRIVKDIVEPPTPHLDYGKEVHKAAEDYVCGDKPIDPKYAYVKPHLDFLKSLPGLKLCEYEMGLTKEFKPVGFKDKNVWFRGIADLLIIDGDAAMIVDYKTGKSSQYADTKQLELLSLLTFKHFPHVQSIKAGLLFVVANDFIKSKYNRTEHEKTWVKWLEATQTLEKALELQIWNPKPNFTCNSWCSVRDCYHNGKKR